MSARRALLPFRRDTLQVAVGGGVRTLRVTGLHASDSAFIVQVLLEGEAGLWVR